MTRTRSICAISDTTSSTCTSKQRPPTRRIWPVRELVTQVRELVEQEYGDVWVEGEISNFRPAPSGHVYFTLKDADAQLPIVLFRRQAMLLRFRPEDGLHVLVRGRVSVYEQRGQLQLVAETMEPVGAGSLQLAFEQLKERLKAEGLFDADRKKPLPLFPHTVGIVTSPTGAVIRDFLNIVSRRHSGLNVLLCPVSVQGESAPGEIEGALAELNANGLVDLIVLARGGGSLEDLAAFNSERVARAIASSQTSGSFRGRTRDRLHHRGLCRRPARAHAFSRGRADYRGATQNCRAPGHAVASPGARGALSTAASAAAADAIAGEPRRIARNHAFASAWNSGWTTRPSAWILRSQRDCARGRIASRNWPLRCCDTIQGRAWLTRASTWPTFAPASTAAWNACCNLMQLH